MKKSFPKHFLRAESFFLFLIVYTLIYWINDVDIQIPGYKSPQQLPENTTLLTISTEDFNRYLVPVNGVKSKRNVCPLRITKNSLEIPLFSAANFSWSPFANFFAQVLDVAPGGEWMPKICVPRFFVALIITLQDGDRNLRDFLMNMHPFLQAQNIHYRVYIVEQSLKEQFNKGALFNVGFLEARKKALYPCFIFHDINFLPKNRNNIYACTKMPRFLTQTSDDLKLTDQQFFGGTVSFLSRHFQMVNGFSNEFHSWKSGDMYVDLNSRILNAGLRPMRFDQNTSSYYLLPRELTQSNPSADLFHQIGVKDFNRGLNTTNYTVISYSEELLFTRIIVDL